MLGFEEVGAIVVVWAISALIFRDWVVRLDLVVRERLTGDRASTEVVAEQEALLERTGRMLLVAGLLVFVTGVGLHYVGIA
jgi:hypothetical protein